VPPVQFLRLSGWDLVQVVRTIGMDTRLGG